MIINTTETNIEYIDIYMYINKYAINCLLRCHQHSAILVFLRILGVQVMS